jgi:hypothetical protein
MKIKYEIKDAKIHDVFAVYPNGYYQWSYNNNSEFDILYDDIDYQDFSGRLLYEEYVDLLKLIRISEFGESEYKIDKIYIDNQEIKITQDNIFDFLYKIKYNIFYEFLDKLLENKCLNFI